MYRGRVKAADSSNIAKEAVVAGDVAVGENSTVLFHAVLRGDAEKIVIGNLQQYPGQLHGPRGSGGSRRQWETMSRSGHNAVIHGCTIGDGSLIGMGAVVLNGAKIGKGVPGRRGECGARTPGDPGRKPCGRESGESSEDPFRNREGEAV